MLRQGGDQSPGACPHHGQPVHPSLQLPHPPRRHWLGASGRKALPALLRATRGCWRPPVPGEGQEKAQPCPAASLTLPRQEERPPPPRLCPSTGQEAETGHPNPREPRPTEGQAPSLSRHRPQISGTPGTNCTPRSQGPEQHEAPCRALRSLCPGPCEPWCTPPTPRSHCQVPNHAPAGGAGALNMTLAEPRRDPRQRAFFTPGQREPGAPWAGTEVMRVIPAGPSLHAHSG